MIAEVVFGKPASGVEITPTGLVVSIQLPVLHGNISMVLADSDTLIARQSGVFHLLQNEDLLVGAACVSNTTPPQTAASLVYHDLLQAVKGFNLVRVWNYVPEINDNNGALENYQSFCVGRAEQFSESELSLPAASAVGVNGDKLIVHFIATRHPVQYRENPEQIPAYRYPPQYGPKSPSFSRASEGRQGNTAFVYISGTASIKGHQSVHEGDLEKQFHTTLDNIRIMKEATMCQNEAASSSRLLDETCIYLRREQDIEALLDIWNRAGENTRRLTILKADICRADLLIEIETQRPLR